VQQCTSALVKSGTHNHMKATAAQHNVLNSSTNNVTNTHGCRTVPVCIQAAAET